MNSFNSFNRAYIVPGLTTPTPAVRLDGSIQPLGACFCELRAPLPGPLRVGEGSWECAGCAGTGPYSSPRSSSRQGVAGLTTPTTPTPAARTLVVVLTLLRCMLTLLRCVLTYSGGGTHHSNARRPHVGGYDARQSLVGALRGRRHPLRALQRRPFSVLLRAGALPIENSSPRKQT
jgi:hypothetical protein